MCVNYSVFVVFWENHDILVIIFVGNILMRCDKFDLLVLGIVYRNLAEFN